MSLYNEISANNRSKYGTESEKILKIIINQYSDRTHFIYEILQNAEDAGATYIEFYLEKDHLRIHHNGRPFDVKDIEGVCGIASGTKEDGTRIGHFGIGFKSVYCYTEEPLIYSGEYHFVIKNQLFPQEVDARKGLDDNETCMILPFNKPEVPEKVAYQEIKDALIKKITAESILMLSNIEDIKIDIVGHPKIIQINKQKYSFDKGEYKDNVFGLSMQTTIQNRQTHDKQEKDSDYLLFTDAEPEASTIIFKVEGKELKAVKNSKIYAFFPTAKEAHQNFYIHAPFDTTPARDNFKEGAEYGKHNIQLVESLGKLIWFAFRWMKDHQYLSVSGFNTVFPIYEYEEDDILYGLYKNSIDIIREEEILPTNTPGVFKRINEIYAPLWGVIVEAFDDEDLRQLSRNHRVSWLAKEFTTESYRDLKRFLDKNFKIETLEWKDLVLRMDATFLSQKSLTWTEKLMNKIESYCVKGYTGRYIDVSSVPLVRITSGEQICARDKEGKLQVYLNNPDISRYKIESTFLANDQIKNFYRRALGIPEYNIEQEMLELILPKYARRQIEFKTEDHLKENIEDLKVIKDAINVNPKLLELVRESYIVTDGKDWYKPSELYIKSNDVRSGFSLMKGIIKIKYLADTYLEVSRHSLKIDEEFLKKIGCNSTIRVIEVTKDEYLKTVRKYMDIQEEINLRNSIFNKTYILDKVKWKFNYEGFPQIFSQMTKEKSIAIARFLNPNAMNFDIQGELVAADDQHFAGKHVETRMAYSMIGLQLCFEKWIYIEGDSNPHRPIDIDKESILSEYKVAKRLMDILPFKEVKNAMTELLEQYISDKSDLNYVMKYLATPEAIVEIAKKMAQSDAKKEARKNKQKSVKELIENGDVLQKNPGKMPEELDINPISESAKEKREKKLEKEFEESLDHVTSFARGLKFTNRSSNKEERTFLEQEYDGHCQICLTQINKYDGEHYFEAINILKESKLSESVANSTYLGWNSLCLCPNCAALYNHSSKKISTIYEQVMQKEVESDSDELTTINIEMPIGEKQTIVYSPRHFLALKTALRVFSEKE